MAPGAEEWKLVQTFVDNTHGPTHGTYMLEVQDLFRVQRGGETERFVAMPHRMLLWHGSRLSNYGGILSQGLRIAPPEAPTTGHMFGKGVYFSDCVSKAANYVHSEDVGLLLLCEVALGTCCEKTSAEYITKLPDGFHSTKGVLSVFGPGEQCRR